MVDAAGPETLSVRGVAEEVGTTTRAVYSLFGSKEGLLVALGTRAFEILGGAISALPATEDPVADLIQAGIEVFRRFAIDHPSLFRIGVQRASSQLRNEFGGAVAASFAGLQARVARVDDAGLLGRRSVRDAATEFHALCEGLAALELRGMLRPGDEEWIWRDALTALVTGFAVPAQQSSQRTTRK
jgi:AcrR family transcriptional regulator